MLNAAKKNHSSFLGIFMTVFAANKERQKKEQIYWVIDESDSEGEEILVKYFNEANQLIHTQTFSGLKKGFLDEASMLQLNQIKEEIKQVRA